ncbi:hypothetical protein ACJW30_05G047200 [Castanea mollissima]
MSMTGINVLLISLSPKVKLFGVYIESELNTSRTGLVEWFKEVELPRIAGFFLPLLKNWSTEYAGSGVAGIIVALSCCTTVGKLCYRRTCCPLTLSIEDALIELMDLSHSLVPVDKLHQLVTEAGFEVDLLAHFGTKVFPSKRSEELEFWIGLAQKKLSVAFQKENMFLGRQIRYKVQADSFATLGIFAYLGKSTRMFLSRMGIKDLDEHVKDFLSYLECGSLFVYPELSSISVYQLFMERRRSKQYPIQAEKEIILTTVFTVCNDVFSGFAHFSCSTLLPIDTNLLEFLLRSQSMLTVCLEDCWAAYDKPCEPLKFSETGSSDATSFLQSRGTIKSSVVLEAQQNLNDLRARGCTKNDTQHGSKLKKLDTVSAGYLEGACAGKSFPQHESLIRKYSIKLASTSSDIWKGTQLLLTDIRVAAELLVNQLCGYQVAERERKKLKRTLNDISSLIPITILMLLPVSAIGHAAILAAIKKYIPFLIPSPYSSETKKMEVQSWGNLEDPSSRIPK